MVTLDERKSNVLLLTCWSKKYYLLRVTIFGYFSNNFLMCQETGSLDSIYLTNSLQMISTYFDFTKGGLWLKNAPPSKYFLAHLLTLSQQCSQDRLLCNLYLVVNVSIPLCLNTLWSVMNPFDSLYLGC